ncbi:hypothetical protein [Streptomyces niveus]|uniref:hypothetical protein n=1 Tax=Streptomyces niveus TaxID=193462 RepID=UPI003441F949
MNLASPAAARVMAALPIARKVVSFIGRPKVVETLANLLAKLIGKWVRPREAKILSTAIVDTGLKLLSMEAKAEEPRRTAATAITATVEDAVRKLAELPAEELEDLVRLGREGSVAARRVVGDRCSGHRAHREGEDQAGAPSWLTSCISCPGRSR